MRRRQRLATAAVLILPMLTTGALLADSHWSTIAAPLAGRPEAVGFYSAGCIAGAQALPLSGPGFQVMRPSRNRFYGHPRLIALLQRLGRIAQQNGARLLIGDLSQPRGGPMRYGHVSHQSGLDADIWFDHIAPDIVLSPSQTESRPLRSVVDKAAGTLRPGRWSTLHSSLLRWVAEQPEVERIFVNSVIKQVLCRVYSEHPLWLNKLRPWWGHADHFHIRLACPPDSPRCRAQPPPPRVATAGCDAALVRWVREQVQPPPRSDTTLTKPSPPAACAVIINTP